MAQASPTLSPKALERIRRYRHAIIVLARYRAKKAVLAQLRAQGHKIQNYSCKDIAFLTDDYMAQHREQLINKAMEEVAAWPEFASVRKDTGNRTLAQPQTAHHEGNRT